MDFLNKVLLILHDTTNYQSSSSTLIKDADIKEVVAMDSDNFIRKDTIGQLKELLLVLNNYKLNAVRLFMYWIHFQNSSSIGW